MLVCFFTVSDSLFSVVSACLNVKQQVIPEGLLIFVWVHQHSIKLFKYAQGYLSKPERLWTYMSPSNRCTDYGLQLAPEEWLKQPGTHVAFLQCTITEMIRWSIISKEMWNHKDLFKVTFKVLLTFELHYQNHDVCFR